MPANSPSPKPNAIPLAQKVAFLGRGEAYHLPHEQVDRRETHMSWVFLAGDRAYKLKKPVCFPYLDFSSLEKRRAGCFGELTLNRRLAPDVYEGVVPLTRNAGTFALGGPGEIVDWLVVMRRLDESQTLEQALLGRHLDMRQLDPLIGTLARFYRRTARVAVSPHTLLVRWHRRLAENRAILLDPHLPVPRGMVRRIDRIQSRFLQRRAGLLAERARDGCIVDGHGDLRPEHIWFGPPVRIIDCLEFNRELRAVDPMEEIAFLGIECARLGSEQYGEYIRRRISRLLPKHSSNQLFAFYRCYRATLRARLAIAHLLELKPRTPAKWPGLARSYLQLALADALRLERLLDRPHACGRTALHRTSSRCLRTACC